MEAAKEIANATIAFEDNVWCLPLAQRVYVLEGPLTEASAEK
jgi:hypothetical protein